ncbi:hypothetical protein [Paenibacillus sp. OV219]|uniref:hypothetical protein n=1 Tax=Paenibacillus sp. OV219 TaxID=1884377 RepID=UPI0008CAD951|nr:hypothetical protein [Paenibacillus sp. OV219]SEM85943.1 hypothetical protein SAMN05518847_101980 [Paenibacillus sp. OV219]
MQMTDDAGIQQLMSSQTDEDIQSFGQQLHGGGFTALRRFLDDFRDYLRQYEDGACDLADELIRRAKLAVPEPGRTSPSWTYIWTEFEGIIHTKRDVFQSIPKSQRDGEWQVLLDNPHSNQNIAVYPGLTFIEAVYMFAYFRTGLTNSEYIRLQKISTVMTYTGAERDGPQPIESL